MGVVIKGVVLNLLKLRVFMKKIKLFTICLLLILSVVGVAADIEQSEELKYIGMPVGGICAGQVYLGGDGQLWYWDIFNIARVKPGGAGDRFYLNPLTQDNFFKNGFAISVKSKGQYYERDLNSNGFTDISFNGEYPIGKVQYLDKIVPVEVNLEAFSPFIPTDIERSDYPAVVMEYTVTNRSDSDVEVNINGWLQNMSQFQSRGDGSGEHINKIESNGSYIRLECGSSSSNEYADSGDMSLTLIERGVGSAESSREEGLPFYRGDIDNHRASKPTGSALVGSVTGEVTLNPGESHTFKYILSWYFPNIHLWDGMHKIDDLDKLRHYYSSKFENSSAVADNIIATPQLIAETKSWSRVWNSSTLPKWFLDRSFVNVSTLATTASVRVHHIEVDPKSEGRFYAFEGVYLGQGTCTHVMHYEQAMGRLFPDLSRQLRVQTDLGLSYNESGVIGYRGEFSETGHQDGRGFAIDGQAGTVMRIYREHLLSPDMNFLESNWEKIRQSIKVMINQDSELTGVADGILEGKQYNTLDRTWYGKITWISGLYAAALRAGEQMAIDMDDKKFAKECRSIAGKAYKNISEELFNGEYFIQKLDRDHLDAPNSNIGCHIDQLLGHYWASQTGLGYIVPKEEVLSSLNSILKYNYVECYEAYLDSASIPVSRYYTSPLEQGVVMCSFPHGGADRAPGKIGSDWEKLVVGYFSEMWTGQEHQLAASLISEGMVDKGLMVERAVDRRYSRDKRNPYNEIEYGNHYTRAMSGYAPFISITGFYYHGPRAIIGFDPKVSEASFRSAFTASQGWGSYSQVDDLIQQRALIEVKYGAVDISSWQLPSSWRAKPKAKLKLNGEMIKFNVNKCKSRYSIDFERATLNVGDSLVFENL